MDRVVITGAGGFIGGHVAEYFCSRGLHPVCMLRDMEKTDFLSTLPVEIVQGDITRPTDLQRVFHGAELLIHTAAKVGDWGRYSDFHAVNVAGTVNVVRAAIDADCRHVIITGSNSCYGEEDSSVVKNEDSGYNPHYRYFLDRIFPSGLNHYRDTKALGNTLAMELATQHDLDLTIIEPVWVYGEREFHSGFYEYLRTVGGGIPFFPGSKKNHFHTIYVRDLARLYFLAALAHPRGVQR
ncbi:MAG: NAD(P)-dependent oxidoreductase, partial [Bacteroidota bacterium]|nr:NAD(P)-dependent oxidoreductase [Bacteroidota bacterium]